MCFYSGLHADYLKEEAGAGIPRSADTKELYDPGQKEY